MLPRLNPIFLVGYTVRTRYILGILSDSDPWKYGFFYVGFVKKFRRENCPVWGSGASGRLRCPRTSTERVANFPEVWIPCLTRASVEEFLKRVSRKRLKEIEWIEDWLGLREFGFLRQWFYWFIMRNFCLQITPIRRNPRAYGPTSKSWLGGPIALHRVPSWGTGRHCRCGLVFSL